MKRKRGRPPGPSPNSGRRPAGEEAATNRGIRLTDAHYAKFKQLGGPPWLRRMIDKETQTE